MSDAYQQLLDATIDYLEQLKNRGVRFVSISPENLNGFNQVEARRPTERAGFASRQQAPSTALDKRSAPAPSTATSALRTGRGNSTELVQAPQALPETAALWAEADTKASAPKLSPEAKAAAFVDLRRRALACVKCEHLASSRRNVVFGVGNAEAELMFIGEAPGADEDQQGEPFVGKAGQLLTRIIETMGLKREQVYIANILKCRPDTPGQPTGNRKPTPQEMETCIPFLHEQIDLIRPKVIVALGATAVEGLLGKTIGITRLRGNWRTYRGIPLMPTYHPAYLLRNQAPAEKRRVWEDMMQVMEKLGMPISEKQRGFFQR